jgi:agmatinase
VQVGIRDFCPEEADLVATEAERVRFYGMAYLRMAQLEGSSWAAQVQEILSHLPDKVYVSFDIDALDPDLCPNTGTPVPGGFSFWEAVFLLRKLADSGKQIIGFDLCEVAPGPVGDYDANVGARVLWELAKAALRSKGRA